MSERWITQDKFYEPEKGLHGNCQQAATASLLGLRIDEVPNFMAFKDTEKGFWGSFFEFAKSRGFAVLEFGGDRHFECYHLASGPSVRGVSHAVVYRAGKLVWDPHPSRAGILEVTSVCVLVPIDLAEWRRT